ncbi:hypothetical protein BHE74_00047321, partial [Ensete ventricosum]
MKTEEDAFWLLAVLLENVLVNDCYTDNLSGCHVEQRVFRDLLAKKCPRMVPMPLLKERTFREVFFQTTLRVWDVLFNEGAKVLFHVALAFFKVYNCILC